MQILQHGDTGGMALGKSEPQNRRTTGTANRRMSNVEPQNVEGWNRCALSFYTVFKKSTEIRKGGVAPGLRSHLGGVGSLSLFYKIDRIPSFDIRHSIFFGSAVFFLDPSFDIRHSTFYGSAVLFSVYSFLPPHTFCLLPVF